MHKVLVALALVACKGGDKPAEQAAPPAPAERPKPTALAGVELPQVSDGFEPVTGPGHVVTLSMTELLLDGKPVAMLKNGFVDGADKTGGVMGLEIAPLVAILNAGKRHDVVQVVIDKRATYRAFVEVLFSSKQAGVKSFVLAGERRKQLVGAPFTLPDRAAVAVGDAKRRPGADLGAQIAAAKLAETDAPSNVAVAIAGGDPKHVAAVTSKYVPGIKRCYKDALERDPSARGKVTITLTVGKVGQVTNGSVKGFEPTVDACIEKQMTRWRFAKPDIEEEPAPVTFMVQLTAQSDSADAPTRTTIKPPDREPGVALDPAAIAGELEPAAPPDAQPVQLMVALSKSDLILASISGLEGTLREPKLRVDVSDPEATAKLGKELADIAQRRGEKGPVIFMADAETPMQRVAEVLGAIRTTHPEILIASGFN